MSRMGRSLFLAVGVASLTGAVDAAQDQGFSVCLLVAGAPAPEYAARGRIYVEALKGREFLVRLSNPTAERVAVALSVDGRNVMGAKRTSAAGAVKWVLGPGETLDVPGWQISGAVARRFFFTETSKSYAKWLGDTANVGTIEAVFYREKRRPPVFVRKDAFEEPLPESAAAGPQGRSKAAPRAPASSENQARSAEAFAATGIGQRTDFPVEWVSFEEEKTPAARIALRYEFHTELVRLGVLPREDDLYARDRAHGFEHEYAPDPYRR